MSHTGSPLRARPADWVFIAVCSLFACTSLLFDAMTLLATWITGDPLAWPLAPAGMQSYAAVDPLLVEAPVFLRVALVLSAFVWGPIYVYMALGFYRGDNGIRVPALMYAATLTAIMAMIVGEELFSTVPGWRTPEPARFLAYNLPYLIFPVAVMVRLRRRVPFGVPDSES